MPPTTGNNMNRDNNRGARARNGEGTSSVVHRGPNKARPKNICGHCNNEVKSRGQGSDGIECDCCRYWVHAQCEGISQEKYKMWQTIGDRAKFYCSVMMCQETADLFFSKMEPMQKQIDENSDRIKELEEVVKKQEQEIIQMRSEIEDTENGPRARPSSSNEEEVVNKCREEIRNSLESERDRVFRSKNIIIARLPEVVREEGNQRSLEEIEFGKVNTLLSTVLNMNMRNIFIERTERLHSHGRPNQDGDTHQPIRPRLLRVRLRTEEMAKAILNSAGRADFSTTDYNEVKIFPDRNKEERQYRKELMAEARARNQESIERNSGERWFANFRTGQIERKTQIDRGQNNGQTQNQTTQ